MIQRLSYLKRKAGLWHSLPDWRPHFYCVVKKPSLQLSRKCLGVVLQQEKAFEGLYFDGSAYFSPCSCCFLWEQFLSDYCVLLAFLVWRLEGALRFALGPLLRRRPSTTAGVQKKGRRRMLYGQMAPDTHFSWSHHEGKNGCWKYTTSSFQTPLMLKAIPHALPNRHDPQLFS